MNPRPRWMSWCRRTSFCCCWTCRNGWATPSSSSAHDMGVHYQITHRMLIMYAAKAVEYGDSDSVFDAPLASLHPYADPVACPPSATIMHGKAFPAGRPACGNVMSRLPLCRPLPAGHHGPVPRAPNRRWSNIARAISPPAIMRANRFLLTQGAHAMTVILQHRTSEQDL